MSNEGRQNALVMYAESAMLGMTTVAGSGVSANAMASRRAYRRQFHGGRRRRALGPAMRVIGLLRFFSAAAGSCVRS